MTYGLPLEGRSKAERFIEPLAFQQMRISTQSAHGLICDEAY
jgi:hypothetical protein